MFEELADICLVYSRSVLSNPQTDWPHHNTVRGGEMPSDIPKGRDGSRFYRVFIKYCVFSTDFRKFQTLVFLCFHLVSVCVHTPGR